MLGDSYCTVCTFCKVTSDEFQLLSLVGPECTYLDNRIHFVPMPRCPPVCARRWLWLFASLKMNTVVCTQSSCMCTTVAVVVFLSQDEHCGIHTGSEGIAWLSVANADDIESGAFYLDRTPQAKHISGTSLVVVFMHKSPRTTKNPST